MRDSCRTISVHSDTPVIDRVTLMAVVVCAALIFISVFLGTRGHEIVAFWIALPATALITIGSAKDGSIRAFIPDPDLAQADVSRISGASGIVADAKGTIYAADVGPHRLRKYVLK